MSLQLENEELVKNKDESDDAMTKLKETLSIMKTNLEDGKRTSVEREKGIKQVQDKLKEKTVEFQETQEQIRAKNEEAIRAVLLQLEGFKMENENVRMENEDLKTKNEHFKLENEHLKKERKTLKMEKESLNESNIVFEQTYVSDAILDLKTKRHEELENQLDLLTTSLSTSEQERDRKTFELKAITSLLYTWYVKKLFYNKKIVVILIMLFSSHCLDNETIFSLKKTLISNQSENSSRNTCNVVAQLHHLLLQLCETSFLEIQR